MHLATELIWYHSNEVNGFPPRIAPLRKANPVFREEGLSALEWHGFFYPRYNLEPLAMKSGNGEPIDMALLTPIMPEILRLVSDHASIATPYPTAILLKRVYDRNNPRLVPESNADPGDLNDLRNSRWGPAPVTSTTGLETFGWTANCLVECAKQLHVDHNFGIVGENDIPGAQQRFLGVMFFLEALLQYLELVDHPEKFSSTVAGEYIRLQFTSNLGELLSAPTAPESTSNRYRIAAELLATALPPGTLPASADGISAMILADADARFVTSPVPVTVRDYSICWRRCETASS